MKTIRIVRNTGADLPRFTEGQVVDVPDGTADMLCGLKLAELLRTIPDEPLKAIPENPTILAAESKLAEIKEGWLDPDPPKPKRPTKTKSDSKE